ncbi:serine dehydrogenasease [Candidatus Parcubacteria bacterium]|nr:serine dehydrogenasease [Candidatus Parcubacteria bacterium]
MAKKVKKIDAKKASKLSLVQEIKFDTLLDALIKGYGKETSEENKKLFSAMFSNYLKQELAKDGNTSKYNLLVLFDNTVLVKGDSDQIYRAVTGFSDATKPMLLVLLSGGGEPGSAYLIGKLCREFSNNNKLTIVVPRHAKSAATLLACAADEIHMGSLSELGPIDPQINRMPTLGLKNSIEHIADLVSKNPKSSEMFAKYLELTVEPVQIGYYERVAESAVQYAERLLEKHKSTLLSEPAIIAKKLVYGYKDHGFVIDKEEAISVFGDKTVKCNTSEYEIGNTIYNILSRVENIADILDYNFYFIGSIESSPNLVKKVRR